MTLADIFQDSTIRQTLAVFSDAEKEVIEQALFDKNGKPYIKCLVRGKEVQAKKEEVVRQLWLYRLLTHYGYARDRLTVEYPITFGRDSSKRADIVVFDADRPTVPYLMVEVKQTNIKGGKEQLRSYTHATGAPLALWSDGGQATVWHRKNPNYFVEIPDLPTAGQTIDDIAGQPWTVQTLIDEEKKREAKGEKARNLRQLIEEAAHTARRQAHTLLDATKRAVEIAIEQGEAEALAYLHEHGAEP